MTSRNFRLFLIPSSRSRGFFNANALVLSSQNHGPPPHPLPFASILEKPLPMRERHSQRDSSEEVIL
jgi:hypothetical protein